MKKTLLITLIALALTTTSYAQTTHVIEAGSSKELGNYYQPQNITIEVGDTVQWHAVNSFHGVDGRLETFPDNPEGFFKAGESAPWTFNVSMALNTSGSYDFQCPVGNHASTMFGTITVENTSSVERIDGIDAFKVFPNPVDGIFHIEKQGKRSIERLEVFNLVGQMVFTDFEFQDRLQVNASQWSPGIYIVRATTDNGNTVQRKIAIK